VTSEAYTGKVLREVSRTLPQPRQTRPDYHHGRRQHGTRHKLPHSDSLLCEITYLPGVSVNRLSVEYAALVCYNCDRLGFPSNLLIGESENLFNFQLLVFVTILVD
jgi:hypothetical protein